MSPTTLTLEFTHSLEHSHGTGTVTLTDPLGMMFYAIALLPLTRKLKNGSAFLLERAEL